MGRADFTKAIVIREIGNGPHLIRCDVTRRSVRVFQANIDDSVARLRMGHDVGFHPFAERFGLVRHI